ncbi:MAG TPA: diguanylate cyclase [Polyangiaceae bacterium]|nr:diguanylate cyclase [Polyangiaceae bacterium]
MSTKPLPKSFGRAPSVSGEHVIGALQSAPPDVALQVLVVDDEPEVRAVAAGLLEAAGLHTIQAAGGAEALDLVRRHPTAIHAVLLDLMMPHMDGLQVLDALRADPATAGIPVLLLTAAGASDQQLVESLMRGAFDHLEKPYRAPVLVARVRSAALRRIEELALRDELERAERLASTDALTGLCNRRRFEALLEQETAYAVRRRQDLALVLLDLDHFKAVNDQFGHAAGDQVLVHVGRLLKSCLRAEDHAFRIGGEEFALLLRDTPAAAAAAVAGRIAERLRASPPPHPVTLSGGVAAAEAPNGYDVRDLFERADRALYRAKAQGRDRIEREKRSLSVAPPAA